MCLFESIALVFIFILSKEKPNEPFNAMSLWTSTKKSTNKKLTVTETTSVQAHI